HQHRKKLFVEDLNVTPPRLRGDEQAVPTSRHADPNSRARTVDSGTEAQRVRCRRKVHRIVENDVNSDIGCSIYRNLRPWRHGAATGVGERTGGTDTQAGSIRPDVL